MGNCYRTTAINQSDKMEEECGVFGLYNPDKSDDLSKLTYLGLHALQHRGQESAGICVNEANKLKVHKGMGLVSNVFDNKKLEELKGNISIGHVRYSTVGTENIDYAQPFERIHGRKFKWFSFAFNGQLSNYKDLKEKLIKEKNYHFRLDSDTEVIMHYLSKEISGYKESDFTTT